MLPSQCSNNHQLMINPVPFQSYLAIFPSGIIVKWIWDVRSFYLQIKDEDFFVFVVRKHSDLPLPHIRKLSNIQCLNFWSFHKCSKILWYSSFESGSEGKNKKIHILQLVDMSFKYLLMCKNLLHLFFSLQFIIEEMKSLSYRVSLILDFAVCSPFV